MEYAEYYKKAWEQSLKERTNELQAENARLRQALEFYANKSNYSLVDEGRNFQSHYVCYELNPTTYGDDELGTFAREALKGEK